MEHEQGSDMAVRVGKDDKLREKWLAFVAQVQKEEFWDENRGCFFPQKKIFFGKSLFYPRNDLLEKMEVVIIFENAKQCIRICCTDKIL